MSAPKVGNRAGMTFNAMVEAAATDVVRPVVEGIAPDEIQGLRGLLEEHQELSRLQGNRIDELQRELGETQARLRAAQVEVQRLTTMLHGYERKARP